MENDRHNTEQQSRCPIVYGLKLISKKWVLEVFCALNRASSLRYSELKRQLGGITNMALTQVLKELAERGLVYREQYNEIPPHTEYSLTSEGKTLLPALYSLAKWGYQQMPEQSTICDHTMGCHALHYEYLPYDKENEVLEYPKQYNDGYYRSWEVISAESGGDVCLAIQLFLEEMLKVLTEAGPEAARWSMTYYFRPDTPRILQRSRPQYQILCEILAKGQQQGIITDEIEASYMADELSKVVTGMVGEWLMDKCEYDIVSYNRLMLKTICRGLQKRKLEAE